MTTPEHLSPPEQPAWLIDAVHQVTEAVVTAAHLPPSVSFDAFRGALQGFDSGLRDHYGHAGHPDVPNAYWLLTAGLAGGVVVTTRMLDPTWCSPGAGGAAIVMSDGRTGEVIDNPDGAATTPVQRAGLAAARMITAIANDDSDTAMGVFNAALATDGLPAIGTIVTYLGSLLTNAARTVTGASAAPAWESGPC